jgi:hypothetical protein
MRYGHAVNTDVPEDPDEAEFPDEPWPDDVIIRIKSHPGPQTVANPTAVGGAGDSSGTGGPTSWVGPALGSAPTISAAAAGLSGYSSANRSRLVEGQPEEPPDEELQRFRGITQKDNLVHALISWATLESYPLRVGVSLPVLNPVLVDGEEAFHEAQLWEETEEEWVIADNHAAFVYDWLSQRLASRSSGRALPTGMPNSLGEMTVRTWKDGSHGYILFTPEDILAEAWKTMEVPVRIEYDDGFMNVGMDNAYTIRLLWEEFRSLTHETWEFGPTLPIRREIDGTVVHGITWEWSELRALINEDTEVQLVQVEAFLTTSDPSVDPEDGHPLAYETILRESAKFETPPLFVKEDSEFVAKDPTLSANVPEWMAMSRQVATGGRRRVLEDGRDVSDSGDEDDEEMVADEEKEMYTTGMDQKLGPQRLSQAEASRQRLIAKASRAAGFPESPKSVVLSTDAQIFPSMKEADEAITHSRAVIASASPKKGLKAAGVPADNPIMGQQVPNYPIVPCSGDGSRAGGFRPRGGSGQTDTCVASGNPS